MCGVPRACGAGGEKSARRFQSFRLSLTNSMIVEGTAGEDAVVRAVEKAGYGASPMEDPRSAGSPLMSVEEEALKDRETPRLAKRLIWSALFLVLLMYITMGHNMLSWPVPSFLDHNHLGLALSQMLLSLFVLGINRDFFISGFRSLSQARRIWMCWSQWDPGFPFSGHSASSIG